MTFKGLEMSSRRDFLKTSLRGLGGLGVLSLGASCSTFDEYIFDKRQFSDEQVVIIGGGITGLYLAHKLRQIKTGYRIFEGSSYLGGRIRSNDGLDYGASLFSHSDATLKKLIKEFNLPTTSVSSTNFYFPGGAEQIVTALKNRVSGLMPYRNIRMNWKLQEIRKANDGFEMVFAAPTGRRTVFAKRVALTLPPSQWARVLGLLQLPEMAWAKAWLLRINPISILKAHYAVPNSTEILFSKKNKVEYTDGKNQFNVLVKNLRNNLTHLEFEIFTKQIFDKESLQTESEIGFEIENISTLINSKTKLGLSSKKLQSDSFFNWADVDLIQSAYFLNPEPIPNAARDESSSLQVLGDSTAILKANTVEGALLEAERVSSIFV